MSVVLNIYIGKHSTFVLVTQELLVLLLYVTKEHNVLMPEGDADVELLETRRSCYVLPFPAHLLSRVHSCKSSKTRYRRGGGPTEVEEGRGPGEEEGRVCVIPWQASGRVCSRSRGGMACQSSVLLYQ